MLKFICADLDARPLFWTEKNKRFGFEPEVTAKLAGFRRDDGSRLRIYEVGVSYAGRTYEEGKKIGWKDGVHALWCIVKYNFGVVRR